MERDLAARPAPGGGKDASKPANDILWEILKQIAGMFGGPFFKAVLDYKDIGGDKSTPGGGRTGSPDEKYGQGGSSGIRGLIQRWRDMFEQPDRPGSKTEDTNTQPRDPSQKGGASIASMSDEDVIRLAVEASVEDFAHRAVANYKATGSARAFAATLRRDPFAVTVKR
jgi:hypothetical protein